MFSFIAVRDRMFLEMQDFVFCPNLIKFDPYFTKFTQTLSNLSKFYPYWPKLPKKLLGGAATSPAPTPLFSFHSNLLILLERFKQLLAGIMNKSGSKKASWMSCSLLIFLITFSFSGAEALRVFDDAKNLLRRISEENLFQMNGIVGFYPANSVQDDIYVYEEDVFPRPNQPTAVLYGLRQQVCVTVIFSKF